MVDAPAVVDDFSVLHVDLCTAVVCSCLSLEETTFRLNQDAPTGISSRWHLADSSGDTSNNMLPCNNYPATHTHYLFEC